MNQQEAYAELGQKIATINALVAEAFAFAKEHKLAMGQPRYSPTTFEVADPTKENTIRNEWGEDECALDRWISSEICW